MKLSSKSAEVSLITCGTGDEEILAFVEVLQIRPDLKVQFISVVSHCVAAVLVVPSLYVLYVHCCRGYNSVGLSAIIEMREKKLF